MTVASDHCTNTKDVGRNGVFTFDLVERLRTSSSQETIQYPTNDTAETRLISQIDDDLVSIGNTISTAQMENTLVRRKDQSSSNKVSLSCFQNSSVPSHPVGLVKSAQ